MSELDWIITKSSLPPILKEVLWEMIENIDAEIEAAIDEIEGGLKDRVGAIESCLSDGLLGDDLIDVGGLNDDVEVLANKVKSFGELEDDIGELGDRIAELESPDDPEEEAMEEEAKEGLIEVELKEMEPQESD